MSELFDGIFSNRRLGASVFKPGWLVLVIALLLAACTRTSAPIDFQTSTPSGATENSTPLPEITREFSDPEIGDLAVVWVEQGEQLPVRASAGIAAAIVAELPYDQRSLFPTGTSTALGSSSWVEIQIPTGDVGWLPDWNLTEQVPADVFCSDQAVDQLIHSLADALAQQDAQGFSSILSPKRDLIVRHDLSNPEVRISKGDLAGIFEDHKQYLWGTRFASQTAIQGSFNQVVLPSLLDVLANEPSRSCNEVEVGQNAPTVRWPGLYENLNYISLHRPAEPGGNTFDWRTWVIVVEYVDGRPTIALMIQIRPQV